MLKKALSLAWNRKPVTVHWLRHLDAAHVWGAGLICGTRRLGFLVEIVVSVELRALTPTEDVHLAQDINCLEAYNLDVGLLMNIGAKRLEFKRLIYSKFNQKSNQS